MKTNGFTLAEVLVTMAIIGIVAATTLPTLNSNVTKGAYISKFKRTVNIMNNVGSMMEANDEYSFQDLKTDSATTGYDGKNLRPNFVAVFNRYAKVDTGASNAKKITLRDGATIEIDKKQDSSYYAIIDVNGQAPPNRWFTCTQEDCRANTVGDKFCVQLHGADAIPSNHVANSKGGSIWAYKHK